MRIYSEDVLTGVWNRDWVGFQIWLLRGIRTRGHMRDSDLTAEIRSLKGTSPLPLSTLKVRLGVRLRKDDKVLSMGITKNHLKPKNMLTDFDQEGSIPSLIEEWWDELR